LKSLETTDIFRGAFYLCNGCDLSKVRFRFNGKQIACFLFEGEGLEQLDRDYRSGKARVNPLQFRESLNHLRDILFEKLRDEGRYENDRSEKHRPHKRKRRPKGVY